MCLSVNVLKCRCITHLFYKFNFTKKKIPLRADENLTFDLWELKKSIFRIMSHHVDQTIIVQYVIQKSEQRSDSFYSDRNNLTQTQRLISLSLFQIVFSIFSVQMNITELTF